MATSSWYLPPIDSVVPLMQKSVATRVERALQRAIDRATDGCPPRLAAALRHAVFPGGGRLRPQLTVLTAMACGDESPAVADAAAAAVELIHCASLVHDDLPCFDDGAVRRGRPSVHAAFGEPTAVLVGDGLIVLAFSELVAATRAQPHLAVALVQQLARATGSTQGLIAGQAWESEPTVIVDEYHRAKTASLFAAAAAMGAIVAGVAEAPWRRFGEALGRAYQAADDANDVTADAKALGKPTGRDGALGRPTLVRASGAAGARSRGRELVRRALAELPGGGVPHALIHAWVERFAARAGLAHEVVDA
jgi:geranylgeranyl diphosphate synthase type II